MVDNTSSGAVTKNPNGTIIVGTTAIAALSASPRFAMLLACLRTSAWPNRPPTKLCACSSSRASEATIDCALAAETILEGLHQHLKLAREDLDSMVSYREMIKFQLVKRRRDAGRGEGVN